MSNHSLSNINPVEHWEARARIAEARLDSFEKKYGYPVEECSSLPPGALAIDLKLNSATKWRLRVLSADKALAELQTNYGKLVEAYQTLRIEAAQRDVWRERYEKLVVEYEKVLGVINNSSAADKQKVIKEFPERALRYALPKLPRFF